MCVGCRERANRSDLLRVVASEVDGVWSVLPDPRRTALGRGASLHPRLRCFDLAERRRAFPRALRLSGVLAADAVREFLVAAERGAPSSAGPVAPVPTRTVKQEAGQKLMSTR